MLESGVVAGTDEEDLVKPYAFVVLKDGHEPSPELGKELQEFVRKGPAPYKYPRWVEFVDALPKTAAGKIKRYQLHAMAAVKTRPTLSAGRGWGETSQGTEPHTNPDPNATRRTRLPSRAKPDFRPWSRAIGRHADAMLPCCSTFTKTFSIGAPTRATIASSILRLAWCGMRTSRR